MFTSKPMRILIVKISSLGDIIHAFSVLEYLKECEPHCVIDWVVEEAFAELVKGHPLVDHLYVVRIKRWRSNLFRYSTWNEVIQFSRELRKNVYDIVFDLQGNCKSALVTALSKSSIKVGFDRKTVAEWPNLLVTNQKYDPPEGKNIREDLLFLVKKALVKNIGVTCDQFDDHSTFQFNRSINENEQFQSALDQLKKHHGLKVLVCAGSHWPNKSLSSETLIAFLKCFPSHLNAHFFLIWGNQKEKDDVEGVLKALPELCSVVERLSLSSLHALMSYFDLIIAMDSLPLHLAGLTPTSTYSIFGASSAKKYQPMRSGHKAFQGSCPYNKIFEKRCELLRTCKTGACMKQLEGKELFDDFYSWWLSKLKS